MYKLVPPSSLMNGNDDNGNDDNGTDDNSYDDNGYDIKKQMTTGKISWFISCALLLFNAGGFVAFASDYFTSIGGYICL